MLCQLGLEKLAYGLQQLMCSVEKKPAVLILLQVYENLGHISFLIGGGGKARGGGTACFAYNGKPTRRDILKGNQS